ncbi:MAG: tRNA (adenosine(37)-N6)-threonylcarbamoyltransferase complex dimerization subunit type 1 TsaB [Desulfovibrionaceae bacterium]
MLYVILNNSDGSLQIGIGTEEVLLYSSQTMLSSKGTEYLIPSLLEAFSRIGYSQKEITHISCVVGPGSFTGIRLILTTALGIAKTLNATLGALQYLESLAFSAYNPSVHYWVMTHARKNLLYLQGYYCNPENHFVQQKTEVHVLSPQETSLYIINNMHDQSYLLGKGAHLYKDFFNKSLAHIPIMPKHNNTPSMEALYSLSQKIPYSLHALTPLYIRPSDAEENIYTIAHKLGFSDKEIAEYYTNKNS